MTSPTEPIAAPAVPTAAAPPVEQSLLDFAVSLARAAGETTLAWFQASDLTVDAKSDGTPVTAADRASERLVRERLEKFK